MTQSALHREKTRIANERCAEALRLRQEGLTFREVGEHFGVSVQRARQMVARAVWVAKEEVPDNRWTRGVKTLVARERQKAKELAARTAEFETSLAQWHAREPVRPDNYDSAIVHAHALQQLWRQFIESHGAWRRPLVGPYRPLHDWLDWRGSAGVTYRNVPGRLEPEWRVSA